MKKYGILLVLVLQMAGVLSAQNNSLEFDGTDDYVSLPNGPLFTIDQMTVEVWVRPDDVSNCKLAGKVFDGDYTPYYYGLGIYNGQIYPEVYVNGTRLYCTAGTIHAGEWTHLAMVYSKATVPGSTTDGTFIAYINGIAVYSASHSLGTIYVTDALYNTIVGGEPWSPYTSMSFDGKMDELRFWSDVRTAAEIRGNMYNELTGSETDLAGYYNFNETSGTTLNDIQSGGFYDGTLTNMNGDEWAPSGAFSGPGMALEFDGTNDYINCGNSASVTKFDAFTMEAWVNLVDSDSDQKILGKFDDWSNYYILGVGGGTNYSQICVNGNAISFATGTVPSGQWTHLAVTYAKGNGAADGTCYAYVNGEVVYSKTDVADASIDVDNAAYPFRIGCAPWDISAFIVDGQVDEVRIWNVQRSAAEIREYMMKSLRGDETGLTAYFNFDHTGGTSLVDFTGNGSDGTMINMDDTDWTVSSAFNTWLYTSSTTWADAANWSDGIPDSGDNVGIYDLSAAPDIPAAQTFGNLYLGSGISTGLGGDMTVNASLILDRHLYLNDGQTVTLGSTGTLIENTGIVYGSDGSVTTTRDLSAVDGNIAGLGAWITEDGDLGSTAITRGVVPPGSRAVRRSYRISATNAPSDATLIFTWWEAELNGLDESALQVFKSADGSTWTEQSATLDTANNTLTVTGITGFSYWTAALTGSGPSLYDSASVTTAEVTGATAATAAGGGEVTGDGGGTVSARGVCWSTATGPTIADDHTEDGTGIGAFTSALTGLAPVTTYYVRAYAVNQAGTVYGGEESFTTAPAAITFTDGSGFTPDVTAGATDQAFGRFSLSADAAGASLTGASITLNGTRTGASNFKLWSSADAVFDTASDTQLGATVAADPGDGATVSFSGFSSAVGTGTGHYFVTCDLSGTSTGSIRAAVADTSDLDFNAGAPAAPFTDAPLSGSDVSVPVTLASFTGTVTASGVLLAWATLSATDHLGFILERSGDDGVWNEIASFKTCAALAGPVSSVGVTEYSYTDTQALPDGGCHYRLSDVSTRGDVTVYAPVYVRPETSPASVRDLFADMSGASVSIGYRLTGTAGVTVAVYDMRGRRVSTLFSGTKKAGNYRIDWHGTDDRGARVPTGTYIIRVKTGNASHCRKIVCVR